MKKSAFLLFCFLIPLFIKAQEAVISSNDTIKEINLMENLPFRFSVINEDKSETLNADEQGRFHFPLSNGATELRVLLPPRSWTQTIFITTGDRVTFAVDSLPYTRYYYHFSGKNAGHYNYGRFLLEQFPPRIEPRFSKDNSFEAYKEAVHSWMLKKQEFLKNYQSENELSQEFLSYANADIINEYAYKLFSVLTDQPNIIPEEEKNEYFENTPVIDNKLSPYYKLAISHKSVYRYANRSTMTLDGIYQMIQQSSYDEEDKSFLTAVLIGFYALKQDENDKTSLMKMINESFSFVKDERYKEYIQRAADYYTILNRALPENILDNTYLLSYQTNAKTSLREILSKNDKKPVYIDFWASWCAPCIDDIRHSQEAKDYLKAKGVEYIYIAIRDKEDAWSKAVEKEGITEKQYFLLNSESELVKYFNVFYIPRYILLDSNHNVINANAARPVAASMNNFKSDVDKCFKKKVIYY